MHEAGIGAEVISPYELWLAEKLDVPGDMILYNGVDKSDASLESAIRMAHLEYQHRPRRRNRPYSLDCRKAQ